MDKSQLESLLARIDIWLLVFGVIVVVGVAGESFFGIRHWWNSRKLQAIQNAENETQRVEIAKLNKETEELRRENLQLQRSVVHRMIPQTGFGEKRNWDSLKPFKGTQVVFLYSPQREPEMFSGNLAAFPANAGWKVLGINQSGKNEIPDGVTVEAYLGLHGETDLSTAAANSLVEFLRTNGIEASFSVSKAGTVPPNTVKVLIGQIPDPSKALE